MIPRIRFYTASSCDPTLDDEPDVQGRSMVISWLGFMVDITVGRHS